MPDEAATRELFDEISAFSRKLRAHFDSVVRERGLTLPRARAMFTLLRRDGLNQRDLAELLELETPTVVRLLDSMEAQAFIERRADDSDRRAKLIYLTPAGKELALEIDAMAAVLRDDLLRGLDDADLRVALNVLTTMSTRLLDLKTGEGRR